MRDPVTVTRTLKQLLAVSDTASRDARAFLYDETRLREAARGAGRILYRAERDVCLPRTVTAADGTEVCWRLDRVRYASADLPTGELNRSLGHWNAAHQWEVFEVEHGEVAMVVAVAGTGSADVVCCQAGSLVCLRPGSWHLTYVLSGPAVVSNAYSAPVSAARTEAPARKYFSRAPVRLGLRRNGEGVTVFADPPWWSTEWCQAPDGASVLGSPDNLVSILAAADDHRLLTDPAGLANGLFPDLLADGGGEPGKAG